MLVVWRFHSLELLTETSETKFGGSALNIDNMTGSALEMCNQPPG